MVQANILFRYANKNYEFAAQACQPDLPINRPSWKAFIVSEAGLSLLNIAIRLTSPACQPGLPILYIRWCRINNANQACPTYYSKLLILLVYQTC